MSKVRWTKTNFPSPSRTGGCNETCILRSLDWVLPAGHLSFQNGLNSKADRRIDDSPICGGSHLFLFNGLGLE